MLCGGILFDAFPATLHVRKGTGYSFCSMHKASDMGQNQCTWKHILASSQKYGGSSPEKNNERM